MRLILSTLLVMLQTLGCHAQMCRNYNNGQQISCDNGLGLTARQFNGNTYYSDGTRALNFDNGDTYFYPYQISPNLGPTEEGLSDPLPPLFEEEDSCTDIFCE